MNEYLLIHLLLGYASFFFGTQADFLPDKEANERNVARVFFLDEFAHEDEEAFFIKTAERNLGELKDGRFNTLIGQNDLVNGYEERHEGIRQPSRRNGEIRGVLRRNGEIRIPLRRNDDITGPLRRNDEIRGSLIGNDERREHLRRNDDITGSLRRNDEFIKVDLGSRRVIEDKHIKLDLFGKQDNGSGRIGNFNSIVEIQESKADFELLSGGEVSKSIHLDSQLSKRNNKGLSETNIEIGEVIINTIVTIGESNDHIVRFGIINRKNIDKVDVKNRFDRSVSLKSNLRNGLQIQKYDLTYRLLTEKSRQMMTDQITGKTMVVSKIKKFDLSSNLESNESNNEVGLVQKYSVLNRSIIGRPMVGPVISGQMGLTRMGWSMGRPTGLIESNKGANKFRESSSEIIGSSKLSNDMNGFRGPMISKSEIGWLGKLSRFNKQNFDSERLFRSNSKNGRSNKYGKGGLDRISIDIRRFDDTMENTAGFRCLRKRFGLFQRQEKGTRRSLISKSAVDKLRGTHSETGRLGRLRNGGNGFDEPRGSNAGFGGLGRKSSLFSDQESGRGSMFKSYSGVDNLSGRNSGSGVLDGLSKVISGFGGSTKSNTGFGVLEKLFSEQGSGNSGIFGRNTKNEKLNVKNFGSDQSGELFEDNAGFGGQERIIGSFSKQESDLSGSLENNSDADKPSDSDSETSELGELNKDNSAFDDVMEFEELGKKFRISGNQDSGNGEMNENNGELDELSDTNLGPIGEQGRRSSLFDKSESGKSGLFGSNSEADKSSEADKASESDSGTGGIKGLNKDNRGFDGPMESKTRLEELGKIFVSYGKKDSGSGEMSGNVSRINKLRGRNFMSNGFTRPIMNKDGFEELGRRFRPYGKQDLGSGEMSDDNNSGTDKLSGINFRSNGFAGLTMNKDGFEELGKIFRSYGQQDLGSGEISGNNSGTDKLSGRNFRLNGPIMNKDGFEELGRRFRSMGKQDSSVSGMPESNSDRNSGIGRSTSGMSGFRGRMRNDSRFEEFKKLFGSNEENSQQEANS